MELAIQPDSNSFFNGSLFADALASLSSGALLCMAHQVSIVEPSGLGILLAAGTNVLTLSAMNKALDLGQIESRMLRICAFVAAIAPKHIFFTPAHWGFRGTICCHFELECSDRIRPNAPGLKKWLLCFF